MLHQKRWKYLAPDSSIEEIKNTLKISDTIALLLANRGLKTLESAEKFLKPSLANLASPQQIPQLEKGAELLVEIIKNKEKIVIYGDYDVDGITATALLVSALKELGGNVSYYIPHRYHEGYSLNKEAIDKLATGKTKWMLTVDCGISNFSEIEYARSVGLKVIVTDHHNPPERLPEAEALINPKLGPKDTPYYLLAGVGVAFKLAQCLYVKCGREQNAAEKFLALTALGTVADMVPLLGENRIITFFGLQKLNQEPPAGIQILKKNSSLKGNITTRSIGFILGPRINAAGRLEDAGIAVDLLLAESLEEAKPLAAKLNHLNRKRQEIGSNIYDDTHKFLENNPALLKKKALILSSPDWHPGVTGIVASQLVRKHCRPAVLISIEGETARGSIRSPEGVNIFEALTKCQDLFLNYGGHPEAAGFELLSKNIPEFTSRYIGLLDKTITQEMLIPELKIDLKLNSQDISLNLVSELNALAPFGKGNSLPIFSTDSLELLEFRPVGDGSHLKVTLRNGKNIFDGIGFGLGEYSKVLAENQGALELAFSLEQNEWNGRKKAQLFLHDLKIKGVK
ncbi:single-stranded-DNA-specific exonuclease RecJ [Candidatus Margulisiibacteriota bacterium]